MSWMEIWVQTMIIQTIVGYSFVLANLLIGLYNIRNLNEMKGDLIFVRAHKWFGRIEIAIFYAIVCQCMYTFILRVITNNPLLWEISAAWTHTWIGGFIATVLVTIKLIYAKFKKDEIYKYGKFLGPLGVVGWSISHWTSIFNFYYFVLPGWSLQFYFVPLSFIWAAIIPFPFGIMLFLAVLMKRSKVGGDHREYLHGVAMILHGISFGYEGSARELVGAPVLYKYVYPKTYVFLERFAEKIGLNMAELKSLNLNDAMERVMHKFSEIGMAEKIKLKWLSNNELTVESINCSTSVVRSYMKPEELENAICPWAILSATIVNNLTGKELEISPSEFNEIGAKTKLKIVDKK